MKQEADYGTASECGSEVREPKMMRIRGELDRAVKRADSVLTRLETLAIALLGNEPSYSITTGSSTDDYATQKVALDPGSLEGLLKRLNELHGNMSGIEHQIDRLASDL